MSVTRNCMKQHAAVTIYSSTGLTGTGLNTSKHPFISFNPYNEGRYDHCTVKGTAANQELK